MFSFLNTSSELFNRGVQFDISDYVFCINCVLGENPLVSYAIAYDAVGFKKVLGTEEEETFVKSKKQECDLLMEQQRIVKLTQELEDVYLSEVQGKALNLKNFKFTGGQIAQILQNLLHNRVADLDSASTKDVIGLIKLLTDQFGLEGGSDFERHFIQIFPKFNALCTNCNKEFQIAEGIGAVCPHCKAAYHWDDTEKRFIPQPAHI